MFLKNLTNDEKMAFMFLADKVMMADNIVKEEELDTLHAFAQEMGLSETNNNLSENETYKILAGSENKVKRAVFTELLSLAFVDDKCEENETECLNNIREELGLPETFSIKAKDWLNSYIEKTKEGFMIIERGI